MIKLKIYFFNWFKIFNSKPSKLYHMKLNQ